MSYLIIISSYIVAIASYICVGSYDFLIQIEKKRILFANVGLDLSNPPIGILLFR